MPMIEDTLPEFDKDLFDFRADATMVPRSGPMIQRSYLLWLKELGERDDVEIDESVHLYRRNVDLTACFVTQVDFITFDLVRDADTDELALGLPEDEPAELWLPLLTLDFQEYGDNGHLLDDHENIFHLHGSDILIIEGKPRLKRWRVRVARLTDDLNFHHGTRFFRCTRTHTLC